MVRIRNRLKVALMAGIAIGRSTGVARGMTCYAQHRSVRPGQSIPCYGMIECRRGPAARRVTVSENVAEIRQHMVGIGCSCKIALMAGVAGSRSAGICARMA